MPANVGGRDLRRLLRRGQRQHTDARSASPLVRLCIQTLGPGLPCRDIVHTMTDTIRFYYNSVIDAIVSCELTGELCFQHDFNVAETCTGSQYIIIILLYYLPLDWKRAAKNTVTDCNCSPVSVPRVMTAQKCMAYGYFRLRTRRCTACPQCPAVDTSTP